jgi:hypothetical protein
MTVLELFEKLKDAPLTAEVSMTVYCPYGGTCLPVEIDTIVTGSRIHADNTADYKVVVSLSPVDGFEFEVCSVSDEQDYEPDFGQCGKCGDWVHFPCYSCQARALEAKTPKRLPEATEEEALMQHIDHIAENKETR